MLKSIGTYSIASGRPESVRFTEVSTKKIVRIADSIGQNEDGITTLIVEEPSIDYFNALNLLVDFVVDTGDLGSKWTAAEVESLKIKWDWSDRDEDWFYSISVSIKKPIQSDDTIPLVLSFGLSKIRDKDLPHEVQGYLNTIYDEAWLYTKGKFEGGTQGQLLDLPTVTIYEEESNTEIPDEEWPEPETDEDEVIDDSDTVKEPVLA